MMVMKIGILRPDEAGKRAKAAVAEWEAGKRKADAEARRAKPAPEAPKAAEKPVVPTQSLTGESEKEGAVDAHFIVAVRTCDLELVRKMLRENEVNEETIAEAIKVAAELGNGFRNEASSNLDWLRSSSSATPMNEMERCTRMAEECDKIAEELRKYGAAK